jgi:hypothetical protein
MNIPLSEVVDRLQFGVDRLKDQSLTAKQQAEILRAISAISRCRQDELETDLKEVINRICSL